MSSKWILTILIMLGLVAGIIVGQLLHDENFRITMSDNQHAHATAVIAFKFVGDTLFLGLLKMLIIPLIATSVIVGVTSVGDFRTLGKVGTITLVYYVLTMGVAASIGLILVTNMRPGDRITQEQRTEGESTYEDSASIKQNIERGPGGLLGALQGLVKQIIPRNIFEAAARGQALPVIFFSILLAIVITTLGSQGQLLTDFFGALFAAIMKLVHIIIWLTPIGVFSLLAWTVARIGLQSFTEAIGGYMLTVTIGLFVHGFVVLPVVCWICGRCNPFKFMHQMRQAMMTALGTDSSSATLPVTIECAQDAGISKRSAGFVLPLGSTINMDGTALYESVAVVFLCQAYGIELTTPQLILVAITATLAAIGAAGIPSAGLVTMVIVINAVNDSVLSATGSPGLDVAAIGLIVGVDRILDMMRTTVNVWGDAVGAKIVDSLDRRTGSD